MFARRFVCEVLLFFISFLTVFYLLFFCWRCFFFGALSLSSDKSESKPPPADCRQLCWPASLYFLVLFFVLLLLRNAFGIFSLPGCYQNLTHKKIVFRSRLRPLTLCLPIKLEVVIHPAREICDKAEDRGLSAGGCSISQKRVPGYRWASHQFKDTFHTSSLFV